MNSDYQKEVATRDAFGNELLKVSHDFHNIVVVSCDLSGATKTKEFAQHFPDRFFEVGIAEQNGVSIACGLSFEGFRPFISSFGAFITQRSYDQIMWSAAYSGANIVIVGSHSGLAIGKDGATQMGIVDLAVMSAIPQMQVFQPSDSIETAAIVRYLAGSNSLAYLRISRNPQPLVNDDSFTFTFNKAQILRSGTHASIFATGDMVYQSLEAAKLLAANGIEVDVVNVATLKPFDADTVYKLAKTRKYFFTVEDHSIIGGLGDKVANVLAQKDVATKLHKIGIPDCFGESGAPTDLYAKYRLDPLGIKNTIEEVLGSNN